MSKQVDERVVSMQFDNKHFEENVKTTMGSLDKLKAKLSFKDASKGFDNLDKAAKKTDMSPLAKSVETVRLKFSALEIMGVTALTNITNSAINAGKRMVSALTIDPVKTGLKEYETQINAVQTILANTQSKGTTIDNVNKALEELNKYADLTIYNFTEMTRNIGTFTAAGVDLETSTNAIKGIANLAAVSGSTSQQASTAMYQLSQALSSGTVKLMDWNSVVNAGMGGQVFQDALKETARVHGVAIDKMIENEGSFRETLKDGWLTSEILTETLQKFTLTTEGLTEEQIKANREMLKSKGYTDDQIDAIFELGKTATDAATKVKTFSQMWDVLKEAAQSGWAQTWKIIIGDFEEAKALLTPLANFFTTAINKMSEARNKLLEGALGKRFTDLAERIKSVAAPVNKVVDALKDYSKITDRIIAGDFGNGQARWDKLAEAGYDWAYAQNLVNEKLGDSTRHATEYTEAQNGVSESQEEATKTQAKLTEADAERIEGLIKLSDAELKALGYTDDQIEAFRELAREADRLGIPIRDFILQLDELTGRSILIKSFKNIGQGLIKVFKAIGDAWRDIFPPMQSDQLYNIIAGFHKLTTKLIPTDDTASDLTRTFKGLFAILDIILTIVGGPIKIAFKIFSQILGAFDLNIWDVTAVIGDAIVGFRDWLDSVLDFTKVFKKLAPYVTSFIDIVKKFGGNLKDTFSRVVPDIISGLKNGFLNGFGTIGSAIANLANFIIDKFKEILGIHSPSVVFMTIGGFIIAGLLAGLISGEVDIFSTLSGIGSGMVEEAKKWLPGLAGVITNLIENVKGYISDIDFGTLLSSGIIGGFVFTLYKITGVLDKFAAPVEAIGDVLESTSGFIDNFGKGLKNVLSSKGWELKSEALLNLAKSIGILAIAIIVLGKTDPNVLKQGGIALAALAGGLVVLGVAAKLVGSGKGITKMAGTLVGMSVAILIITAALKNLSFLTADNIDPIMEAMLSIIGLIGVTMLISKIPVDTKGLTGLMLGVSVSLLVMAKVMKTLGTMDPKVLAVGQELVIEFLVFIGLLIAASKIPGSSAGLGGLFFGIAASLLAMTLCIKILGTMEPDVIKQGSAAIAVFVGLIMGLLTVNKLIGGSETKGMAGLFFGVGVALLAMALSVKILGTMKEDVIEQGTKAILAFGAVIAVLLLVSRNSKVKGLMGTLLAASVAIGILAGICIILGMVSEDKLKQGVIAVTVLGALMAVLIGVSKNAKGATGGIVAITVAIAVIVASVIALSFIKGTELAGAAVALGVLMTLLSVILKISGQAQKAMGPLIALSVCIGVLAGVIYLVSTIPTDKLIPAVTALSAFLIVMTGVLVALAFVGGFAGQALVGVLALTALAVPLLAFIGILSLMTNVTIATDTVNALVLFVGVLTLLLLPLSLVGTLAVPALAGVIALTALAVPLLAFIGIIALMEGLENAELNVNILINLLNTLSGMMLVLAVAGPLALVGVVAVTALEAVIVAFGALVMAVGALFEMCPGLENFIDTGLPILEKLATGMGSVIGSFVNGMATGIGEGLSKILEPLNEFVNGLVPIMDVMNSMSGVDTSIVDSVNTLAEAILAITAADFLSTVMAAFGGGDPLDKFCSDIILLGAGLKGFADEVVGINPNEVKAAADAAKAIAQMTKSIPTEGGVKGWLVGETSISKFGGDLTSLGQGLKSFSSQVTGIDCEAVKAGAEAAKTIAEMASVIPNEGGVVGWFAGENGLGKFSGEMVSLGEGIAGFAGKVAGIDCNAVVSAATAAKSIAEMADKIPNEGGVVAWFTGDNSMSKFAGKLPELGKGMKGFSDSLAGMNATNVKSAAEAGKAIAQMVNTPLSGDASILTNIGSKLGEFGGQLKTFCDKVSPIKNIDDAIVNIEKAVYIEKSLADLSNYNIDSISTSGKNLTDFATNLSTFTTKMSGINQDSLTSAFTKFDTIITSIKNIGTASTTSLKTLGDELKNSGTEGVKSFISAFTSEISTTDVTNAMNGLVTAAVNAAKSDTNYNNYVNAGKYAIQGFVAGLSNETELAKVTTAGTKLGNYAYEAAKKAIDAHSPSKKFKELGLFSILGFSNGIKDNLKTVDESGRSIGTEVLTAFQDEMKIHSPSVVMNEQGHYIVQGVAEGIEDDMSAEEAAEQKAQNIISAFKKVFDNFDVDSDIAKNKFELWSLTDGKGASTIERNSEYAKYLEGQLERDKKANDAAYDKWQQMLANGFSSDSKEAKEAFNEFLESSITVGKTEKELREYKLQEWDDRADLAKEAIDAETSEYETWLATEGRYADKETLYKRMKDHLDYELLNLQDIENRAKWKLDWLKENGGTEEEIAAAREKYNDAVQNRAAKEDELDDLSYAREYADKYDQFEKNEKARTRRMRLWEANNGDTASTAERLAMEETLATEEATDAVKESNLARKEYIQVMADAINGKASAEEVEAARIKMEEADIEAREKNSDLLKIKRDIIEDERDTVRDIASLTSEIAQHEYDVWEKTAGRKATDSEKDAKRLEILARQLESQKTMYNMALADVRTARETYGADSQEYRDAYRTVLQEESALVNMQDEIMTTKENLEKRQKKHYNKQQLAMSEYKDYIKKYREYYLEHGLTMEDLERDARAAANYDPTKTVETVVNKTSSALNSALSTSGAYSIGTSYVESVSTGMSENIPTVLETAQGMLDSCTETLTNASSQWSETGKQCVLAFRDGINENTPKVTTVVRLCAISCVNVLKKYADNWKNVGLECVNGLAQGIRDNSHIAVAAAESVMSMALAATCEEADINSPSKAFWNIAKYCVQGIAGGFIDNSNMSEDAARSLAEEAVNSFTLAIQQITDSVDSDLDVQPTIRPVLDLSNVERGAARLTSMFSRDQAVSISAMRNANNDSENQNGANASSEGKTINYVQNNYSPKALSPTDIYRRTKNQLSAMKGAL